MASEKVGTILVSDDGSLKGLVTDRQIATKVVASGNDPAKIRVPEFMARDPVTFGPEMVLHEAVKIIGIYGTEGYLFWKAKVSWNIKFYKIC
jgi:predicted transcriptional regulator